jgi:hypothetical protein
VHAVDQVLDPLLHALRRDAHLLVVGDLLRAADGLDQRALGTQESFLVRIEDRDQ